MRVALVTGGARGIGASISRAMLDRGLRVGIGYRSSQSEADALVTKHPDTALAVRYALGEQESAVSAVDSVVDQWGALDSLVLNAGIWLGGKLDELDQAEWWRVVQTNVQGMAQLCGAALPALRKSADPSIVIVSSSVGLVGFPGDTAYATAKSAMFGFARSLAKENARENVRVNVLAPGFVETDMTADVPDVARQRIERDITMRRFGRPEEIAAAAVFLSEDATYCTGAILAADGGWSL